MGKRTDGPAAVVVAFIFDTDGVVTRTAAVHAGAWKEMFDAVLRRRAEATGEPFVPMSDDDYLVYVDGKARFDGVAAFLESRRIELPYGDPDDPPTRDTVCGLGNRKNELFLDIVRRRGVEPFESTLELARRLRAHGLRTAVVSASENAAAILDAAHASELFEARVDGLDARELDLAGKPDPALFLEAARRLGVAPSDAAVVEDSLAGVEAGHRGGFGLVVGVDRAGQADELAASGADVVVPDLSYLDVDADGRWSARPPGATMTHRVHELPDARSDPDLRRQLSTRPVALFLDYDGTLTPIVARPELAVLGAETRAALRRVEAQAVVAILSGRDLDDVRAMVDTDGLWFAGSHGFDVTAPDGTRIEVDEAVAHRGALLAAAADLDRAVAGIPGAWVERKRFADAVHYRQVDDSRVPEVEAAVDRALAAHPGLRKTGGKRIFELRPDLDWDKGRALWSLFDRAGLRRGDVLPVFIGDDVTDEDAFAALGADGVGIVVADDDRVTAAHYRLTDPDEVRAFLGDVASLREEARR